MPPTVLITGASSGIGAATARQFLDAGWTVYATARDVADISDLADAGCRTAALDVTDDAAVADVVGLVEDETGGLDCLVNNAGYGQFGVVEDVDVAAVRAQFDVNVFGPYRLVRAALPGMRERGQGTIVNVSSVAGWFPLPAKGAYNASKFALRGLTETLQAALDGFGVDVVLVDPEFVETGFHEAADNFLSGLDRTAAYDELYEQVIAYEHEHASEGIAPSAVAERIVGAAVSDSPRARYPVGPRARLITLLSYLPVGVRTRMWKRFA
jgi:NAD(P)-dependent dehydrogenase (short-subunit alcohol dehydrogenase family)